MQFTKIIPGTPAENAARQEAIDAKEIRRHAWRMGAQARADGKPCIISEQWAHSATFRECFTAGWNSPETIARGAANF